MSDTLWAKWEEHAAVHPAADAIVTWAADAEPHRWTWAALLSAARGAAASLLELGVRKGDVCGLMLRHGPLVYPIYMGISAIGAIPSVLAYPNARLHRDKFVHGLVGMARRSGLRWLLTERDLEGVVRPLVSAPESSIEGLLFPLEMDLTERRPLEPQASPDGLCLLQHSSGTTGLQKAVALSHRAVMEHAARYGAAIGLRAEDKIASWLPLYHDMGLIAAFHLPLAAGITAVQIDPFEWVSSPGMLLEAITREKATLCWLPNFAYNFMADRVRDDVLESIDLRSMRMFVNCSEPVRADSHEKFLKRFAGRGLDPRALGACYAMAEATFAVTQTAPGWSAPVVFANRAALAAGRFISDVSEGASRLCASSGRPISGCDVKVVGADGVPVPDGTVGDIVIRSVSLFDGYRNDEALTKAALRDGWYSSGDYGFCAGNELYVVGRRKDIIIVAGKNLHPEDVEDAVGQVPGVIPGRVVAFGEEDDALGTEVVAVAVETNVRHGDQKALRLDILKAGMAIDVTIGRIYLAPPRWLIKSSAGKLSRGANKDRVGELCSPKS